MKSTTLRGAALVATTALVTSMAGTLAFAPVASAAALPVVAGADPAPAAVGATYLAAQPGADGIIHTYYAGGPGFPAGDYDDYGLTIDAATALDAAGGQAAKVTAMTAAVRSHIDDYVFGANSGAKMAAFLLARGQSGTDVTQVVQGVNSSVTSSGRISDNHSMPDDFASPLGQAYAATALAASPTPQSNAAKARDFLLTQQCAAGFVRDSFSRSTTPPPAGSSPAYTDQSCDAAPAAEQTPSVDTTAFTVLDLQAQKATPAVAASLASATGWLLTQQAADGSFNSGNANSTGLAGWALGVSGQPAAAAKAAAWLRGQQLANAGTCAPYAGKDNGAVTLDSLGYKKAASGPLSAIDNSTATRATAQALPALLWAPGGAASGDTTVTPVEDFRFVKAGSTQAVTLAGAPGNTLCVTVGSTATRIVLPAAGSVLFPVTLPQTSGTTTIAVVDAGAENDSYGYDVLGAKKLRLKSAKNLVRGETAKVTVKGLAPKEKVRIRIGTKIVRRGHANRHGVFKRHIAVTHRAGKATLKVLGQFGGLRNDAKKIRITR